MVWLNDDTHLALFPAGIIVRDPHYHVSDMPQTGFEPAQNLSSDFVERGCAVVITTTSRRVKAHDLHLSFNIFW